MTVDTSGGISVKKHFEYFTFIGNTYNKITGDTPTGEYILPFKNINNKISINIYDEQLCLIITGSTSDWIINYINSLATTGYTGLNKLTYENRIIYNETDNEYYKIEYYENYNNIIIDNSEMWAIIDHETGNIWNSGRIYFEEINDAGDKTGRNLVMLKNINPNSETRYQVKYITYLGDSIIYPIIDTVNIEYLSARSVLLKNNIELLGNNIINDIGVCYGIYSNPTINDLIKKYDNLLIGEFEMNLFDLIPNTTYYIRTYVELYLIDKSEIIYGDETIFTTEYADSIVDKNIETNNIVDNFINNNNYTFLQFSDLHGNITSLENIVNYSNLIPITDIINCGDSTSDGYSEDISNIISTINKSKRPYYPIIGNHDKSGYGQGQTPGFSKDYSANTEQVYNKFIKPFEIQNGIKVITTAGVNLPYYCVDDSVNKIKKIFLYEFDNDLDAETSITDYAIGRGFRVFGQEQIEWLCNILQETTSDYSIMITHHMPPFYLSNVIDNDGNIVINWTNFKSYTGEQVESSQVCANWILPDIVDAWLNQKTINNNYGFIDIPNWVIDQPQKYSSKTVGYFDNNTKSYLESNNNKDLKDYTIRLNFTFTGNTSPKFIGFFFGHTHSDSIGKLMYKTPNQNIICVTTSNYTSGFARYDDLVREANTKSQDAFNICSIDTNNRMLYIVRVGANTTKDGNERTYTELNY